MSNLPITIKKENWINTECRHRVRCRKHIYRLDWRLTKRYALCVEVTQATTSITPICILACDDSYYRQSSGFDRLPQAVKDEVIQSFDKFVRDFMQPTKGIIDNINLIGNGRLL